MKQISLFLFSAIVLAVGSAFASKPVDSPTFTSYYNKNTCAPVSLPGDCHGGSAICKIGTDPIVSVSCAGNPVNLHP